MDGIIPPIGGCIVLGGPVIWPGFVRGGITFIICPGAIPFGAP